jgi:hypothetical protein
MEDSAQVWIYTNDGHGHFTHTFTIAAGTSPTGLNVVRNAKTGFLDLLVGDPFGDVLRLQGKGDGTFQAAGSRVSLAVQDLGNGQASVLVANQQTDRVTIQASLPGSPQFAPVVTLADGTQSTLAPGAVQWAQLDRGSPYYDALVLASGGNAVLVYRGTGFDAAGRPTFAAPVSYAVGTGPVGLTIQDLNSDGIPDLVVADQGSNDVAILFGAYGAGGAWVATPGPRLRSGGQGPVATAVRDVNGDGIPDLVVTNGQSGTFTVLPGVGQGFFNDTNPQVLNVPGNPVLQAPSFVGASSQGVVATGDGRLIGFDLTDFAASVHTVFTPPAGEGVDAAAALADGQVVAALAGGAVVDLAPSAGGLAVEQTFQALTGIPSEPSTLAVLQGESGLRVLVTDAGGDQVFVFGIPVPPELPGVPVSPGLPEPPLGPAVGVVLPPPEAPAGPMAVIALAPPEGPAGPAVEVTPPAAGSLTLVVTLVTGPPTVAGLPGAEEAAADVPQVGAAALARAVAAPGRSGDPNGGGDDEGAEQVAAAAEEGGPRPGAEGLDLQERLRGLDLYQPTPNPDRSGPTTRQPDGQGRWDRTLLAWALDDGLPPAVDVAAELPAGADEGQAADALFALAPATWDGEGVGLPALPVTGFASADPARLPADAEAAESGAPAAELARAVASGVPDGAEVGRAADAMFVLPPAAWDGVRWPRLALALAGFAWRPRSDGLSDLERRTPGERGRQRVGPDARPDRRIRL